MAVQHNAFTLAGYLTRDPELRFTNSGIPVCNFGLAVNRRGNNTDAVDFFDVTVWREAGEAVANYMKKGSAVLVAGRIEFQQFEDRAGNKRSKHVFVANEVQFLDRKSDSNGGGQRNSDQEFEDASGYSSTPQGQQRRQARQPQPQRRPQQPDPDLNEEDFDDIPF